MAILRKKEIKNMPKEDVIKRLKDLKMELIKLNAQRATHQNVGKIREVKKTIARLLTKINQKNK